MAYIKYSCAKTIDSHLTSGYFLRPYFFTIPIILDVFYMPNGSLVIARGIVIQARLCCVVELVRKIQSFIVRCACATSSQMSIIIFLMCDSVNPQIEVLLRQSKELVTPIIDSVIG